MKAPDKVKRLIEVFDRNLAAYKSSGYKEANVRSEFIDPFFEALEWDVYNKQGYAEAYKDVITEDAIKIGGVTKAPDYCFRIGGARKFFVEAKKPSVDIKSDISPAYQLRRYAWSAGLPLSILTDFEEFAVYDCRIRPQLKDKSGKARVIYLTFRDYIDKWEEISSIFSKKAVLEGFFDKYVESKKKRSTQEVDAEFLKEIENWRLLLARNIALRNSALGTREINFAVQRTIDRIIFLRICEDRGIESYGQLQALLNGANIYERLRKIFRSADEKYNSGLFHFHREKDLVTPPDELTLGIKIDDRVLKEIFKQLYYPDSPYEFSVLGADILGHIYEQFLGKVITLTKGHQAKVEEKPEVRKAGGVYYTPTYIVDYIVKNTVGKLCEGKPPKKIEKLRILDLACGSGSFLIGAYNYLNDYHRDWYLDNLIPQLGHEGYISMTALRKYVPGKKPEMPIYQGKGGQWYLTTREKKRILLNNIYGVDIDSQAVEVTKLSLLLKVLENENQDTLEKQMKLWRERALPDLGNNIKCGNSLIGPDFYDGEQLTLLDDEEQFRINVFDWNAEFPEIMQKGGFDAVIGNPPYVRQERLGALFKDYAKSQFSTFAPAADLYIYFVERAHNFLRVNGYFGMICSNKFIRAKYGKLLRNFLSTNTILQKIVDFGELPVFQNAATFPAIFLTQKQTTRQQKFLYAPIKNLEFQSIEEEVKKIGIQLDNFAIEDGNWTLAPKEEVAVLKKMKKRGVIFREYIDGEIYRGILTGLNKAFIIDFQTKVRLIAEDPRSAELIKPFVVGDDVRKYHINCRDRYLILIPKGWTKLNSNSTTNALKWFKENYKALAAFLEPFTVAAQKRRDKGDYWWELRACDYYNDFNKKKLVWPEIAKESRFAYDRQGIYLNKTCFFSPCKDLYLLAILNSKIVWFFLKKLCSVLGDADKGGRLLQQKIYIEQIPIPKLDLANSIDEESHKRIIRLVEKILDLNERLAKVNTPTAKTQLDRQIKATDNQIDRLVYKLYGLTEKEIEIVEGSIRE